MICPNCKTESNGIKLNGKLFCSQCGSMLPENKKEIDFSASVPEAKIINIEKDKKADKLSKIVSEIESDLEDLKMVEQSVETKKVGNNFSSENNAKAIENMGEISVDSDKPENQNSFLENSPKEIEPQKSTPNQPIESGGQPQEETQKKEIDQNTKNESALYSKSAATTEKQNQNNISTQPEESQKLSESISSDQKRTEALQLEQNVVDIPTENLAEPEEPNKLVPINKEKSTETNQDSKQPQQENGAVAINLIQPEKTFCVKCKTYREIQDLQNVVLKNGHHAIRGRCGACGSMVFKITKGQTKKLFHPHHNKNNSFKSEALAAFMKAGVQSIGQEKKAKKQKQKSGKRKIFWIILLIFTFVALFIGLVIYVNNFAPQAEELKNRIEKEANFTYQKPKYIPAGYKTSKKTNLNGEKVNYVYELTSVDEKGKEYLSDELRITIFPKTQPTTDLLKEIGVSQGESFSQEKILDTEIYIIENKKIVFELNQIVYEISSSGKISKGELLKIAQGIIE